MSNGEQKGKSFSTLDLLAMSFSGGPAFLAGFIGYLLADRYGEQVKELVVEEFEKLFNEINSTVIYK